MNHPAQEQEQNPQGDAPSEFENSFAEFSSDAAPPPAPAGDVEPEDQTPAPESEPQPAPAEQPEAGTEIAADDAAPAPSADAAPTDIWATAPPELKAAYDAVMDRAAKAEHRFTSENGRVVALSRQLDELRRQPAVKEQQPEAPPKLKDLLESDEIKAFQTEYAEVASPILNLLRAQQVTIDRLEGTAQHVEQTREAELLQTQARAYIEAHPDYADFANHEGFAPWLETQPRYVQEAARRNAVTIVDAAEASDLLTRFKQHIGVGSQAQPAPDPQPEPAPAPTPPPTDARRQRQLDAGTDVRTKGPTAAAGIPDSFDAAFAAFATKAR